eukprot:1141047-Pelagomonas_calceolata.AAC.2
MACKQRTHASLAQYGDTSMDTCNDTYTGTGTGTDREASANWPCKASTRVLQISCPGDAEACAKP